MLTLEIHNTEAATKDAWRVDGRCRDLVGTMTHLFFSEDYYEIARAKAICAICPVAKECLAAAAARGACGAESCSRTEASAGTNVLGAVRPNGLGPRSSSRRSPCLPTWCAPESSPCEARPEPPAARQSRDCRAAGASGRTQPMPACPPAGASHGPLRWTEAARNGWLAAPERAVWPQARAAPQHRREAQSAERLAGLASSLAATWTHRRTSVGAHS